MDKLDLTQPIKAHHRDGRVVEASAMPNGNVTWRDGNLHHCAIGTDGPLDTECGDWTLRNVIRAKPSTPSNEELTQRMEKARDEALDLIRDMAAGTQDDGRGSTVSTSKHEHYLRAHAIVSDLPKPVDPIDPDQSTPQAAWQELDALANLINRPPHDDVNLVEGVALRAVTAIRIARKEREALHSALVDLVSWFDGGPSSYGPWIIKAGSLGADDAIGFARTLAAGGTAHE